MVVEECSLPLPPPRTCRQVPTVLWLDPEDEALAGACDSEDDDDDDSDSSSLAAGGDGGANRRGAGFTGCGSGPGASRGDGSDLPVDTCCGSLPEAPPSEGRGAARPSVGLDAAQQASNAAGAPSRTPHEVVLSSAVSTCPGISNQPEQAPGSCPATVEAAQASNDAACAGSGSSIAAAGAGGSSSTACGGCRGEDGHGGGSSGGAEAAAGGPLKHGDRSRAGYAIRRDAGDVAAEVSHCVCAAEGLPPKRRCLSTPGAGALPCSAASSRWAGDEECRCARRKVRMEPPLAHQPLQPSRRPHEPLRDQLRTVERPDVVRGQEMDTSMMADSRNGGGHDGGGDVSCRARTSARTLGQRPGGQQLGAEEAAAQPVPGPAAHPRATEIPCGVATAPLLPKPPQTPSESASQHIRQPAPWGGGGAGGAGDGRPCSAAASLSAQHHATAPPPLASHHISAVVNQPTLSTNPYGAGGQTRPRHWDCGSDGAGGGMVYDASARPCGSPRRPPACFCPHCSAYSGRGSGTASLTEAMPGVTLWTPKHPSSPGAAVSTDSRTVASPATGLIHSPNSAPPSFPQRTHFATMGTLETPLGQPCRCQRCAAARKASDPCHQGSSPGLPYMPYMMYGRFPLSTVHGDAGSCAGAGLGAAPTTGATSPAAGTLTRAAEASLPSPQQLQCLTSALLTGEPAEQRQQPAAAHTGRLMVPYQAVTMLPHNRHLAPPMQQQLLFRPTTAPPTAGGGICGPPRAQCPVPPGSFQPGNGMPGQCIQRPRSAHQAAAYPPPPPLQQHAAKRSPLSQETSIPTTGGGGSCRNASPPSLRRAAGAAEGRGCHPEARPTGGPPPAPTLRAASAAGGEVDAAFKTAGLVEPSSPPQPGLQNLPLLFLPSASEQQREQQQQPQMQAPAQVRVSSQGSSTSSRPAPSPASGPGASTAGGAAPPSDAQWLSTTPHGVKKEAREEQRLASTPQRLPSGGCTSAAAQSNGDGGANGRYALPPHAPPRRAPEPYSPGPQRPGPNAGQLELGFVAPPCTPQLPTESASASCNYVGGSSGVHGSGGGGWGATRTSPLQRRPDLFPGQPSHTALPPPLSPRQQQHLQLGVGPAWSPPKGPKLDHFPSPAITPGSSNASSQLPGAGAPRSGDGTGAQAGKRAEPVGGDPVCRPAGDDVAEPSAGTTTTGRAARPVVVVDLAAAAAAAIPQGQPPRGPATPQQAQSSVSPLLCRCPRCLNGVSRTLAGSERAGGNSAGPRRVIGSLR